jgi:hypothetical protein
MIRLSTSCISLIVVLMFAGISYAQVDPNSVVAIWLFDEGSGTTARDASGNGNHGTLTGGVSWVQGKFGKALEFNGTDGYVDTGQQLLEQVEEFSILLWVQKGNITASRIGLAGQNDTVEFGFIDPTTVQVWSEGAGTSADVNYAYPEGEWHHVAATGDLSSLKNYLDGTLGGQTAIGVANHGSSAFNFNIGGGGVFDDVGNFYTGAIDEVAVFNVALAEDDIKTIMESGLQDTLGLAAVSSEGKLATSWGCLKAGY